MDATLTDPDEPSHFINRSKNNYNIKPEIEADAGGKPHIIFYSTTAIQPNEELLYDYGDRASIKAHPYGSVNNCFVFTPFFLYLHKPQK